MGTHQELDDLLAELEAAVQPAPIHRSSSVPSSLEGRGGDASAASAASVAGSSSGPASSYKSVSGTVSLCDASGPAMAVVSSVVPAESHLFCTKCDFRIEIFEDTVWHKSVDYLFLRNYMPDRLKLAEKLIKKKGARAYCCQCTWISAAKGEVVLDPYGSVRWVVRSPVR
eukprot:ANDGO_00521.mRNA.1 hypothetical protein